MVTEPMEKTGPCIHEELEALRKIRELAAEFLIAEGDYANAREREAGDWGGTNPAATDVARHRLAKARGKLAEAIDRMGDS